jgi:hypothetical protein
MKNFTIVWMINKIIFYDTMKGHGIDEISDWCRREHPDRHILMIGHTKHLRIMFDGAEEMRFSLVTKGMNE